ncbi:Splicing factor 3A subunit 1 [Rhizoctonia solani]|uniref:Splicing factor 3A subunit 1 n=1 Tax=Rhizoctonia solani TaxID=456999 RepID=A0A0K6G9I3_9AGAM|nr:Splicing factor 3A subunit 1 [Rhizoctonia solani]
MSVAVANPMNAMMDSQVNAMIEDAVASANQQNPLQGADSHLPKTGAAKFATGMIYPPPDIRTIIDRTASFVARSSNPVQFEDKIRESQRNEPKFSFLNSADPYHAYYRHRIQKVEEGEDEPEAAPVKQDAPQEVVAQIQAPPKEPPAHEFVFDAPQVTAVDLDIIKLTALYTARRGRPFLNALMAREARNFQFDFLRPNHSLFSYFNNLVEQYTRVLRPPKELLAKIALHATPEGKWDMLAEARERATYERWRREREKKKEDDQEAERIAFAEIDWHDYHVVQTIEFTAADATSDLPPPMSIAEVENMTLAQKRMAAQIMEATAPDVEAYRAANVQLEEELDPEAFGTNGLSATGTNADDEEMRERKRKEAEEREREEVRAREMQNGTNAPMKIRKDYVPKTLASKAASKQAMTTCTICGQQVPEAELAEHRRIELLDPKWKTQRDNLEMRRAQANELQGGANVVTSLRDLARTRTDIFGAEAEEEARKKEAVEEQARRREREKVVWDGHTASKAGTLDKFQSNANLEEQIAAIHKAKLGIGAAAGHTIGPTAGPSGVSTLPINPSLPANPTTLPPPPMDPAGVYSAGATVFAAPQPLPPPHPSLPAMPTFAMSPSGIHPSRLAAMGMPGAPSPVAGVVRSADEMNGGDGMQQAAPKRPRVEKLPEGRYYTEQDWQNLHNNEPVSINVQLPNHPENPEWKMNGQVVAVPDLPLTLLISTLRDRVQHIVGSSLGASWMRFSYNNKPLTNNQTLASYNLGEGDLIVLDVRKKK